MINIQTGKFLSDGNAKYLSIRSDVDYIRVINYSNSVASVAGSALYSDFYWQRGMLAAGGLAHVRAMTTGVLTIAELVGNGFTLIDSNNTPPSAAYALTAISGATPPVVTSAAGAPYVSSGDIVRIYSTTGATQFGGIDFTATAINSTTFSLPYAPTIAAGTNGTFRVVQDTAFYPRNRTISSISQASQAVVKTTVTHGFTVGQRVRFIVPSLDATYFGMTELNGLEGNVVQVYSGSSASLLNTFTVDIDTSGFTAFAWPLTGVGAFTPAQVVPVGVNTPSAINPATPVANQMVAPTNPFLDATRNLGFLGIKLAGGATGPAGAANDVIYWEAGKAFNVNNEI